ncbi:MAG TPA: DNA-protecting protein DprA [Clostridia bacterium]|nr:DNA-protecting protein DprA [Clostridia bacterium]
MNTVNTTQGSRDSRHTKDLYSWIHLANLPGIGPRRFLDLLSLFGSPAMVLSLPEGVLRDAPGIGAGLARVIAHGRPKVDAEREVALMEKAGVTLITYDDPFYPGLLREIHDPPPYLYVAGNPSCLAGQLIAIVGTRKVTPYGRAVAKTLARDLAGNGFTIVSGLAIGVDTWAHVGALEGGGATLAVLGCGVDVIYPNENRGLAAKVLEHGCLASEFPMGTKPGPGNFPERNRIVSGMSLGTIVVEAGPKSGALITAKHALEQNREVFAVPGSVLGSNSKGCHDLIKSGARLVESWEDVVSEIPALATGGLDRRRNTSDNDDAPLILGKSSLNLSYVETAVYNALKGRVSHSGEVVRSVLETEPEIKPGEVLAALSKLCMTGVLVEYPGRFFGVSPTYGGRRSVSSVRDIPNTKEHQETKTPDNRRISGEG